MNLICRTNAALMLRTIRAFPPVAHTGMRVVRRSEIPPIRIFNTSSPFPRTMEAPVSALLVNALLNVINAVQKACAYMHRYVRKQATRCSSM